MTIITCTINTETHKVVSIEPDNNQVIRASDAWLDGSQKIMLNKARAALRTAIAAAPPYPADDGWIPCSERLPDREGYFDVFVRSPGESIYNGRQADVLYCDSRWQATLQYGQHVSHWRPLPLPAAPKGE